jgi:hypothetical protein
MPGHCFAASTEPQVYEIDNPAWADPKKENKRAMREFCN